MHGFATTLQVATATTSSFGGFDDFAAGFSEIVWGPWLVITLTTVGLVLTFLTRGIQIRAITHGFSVIRGKYDDPDDEGNISHFQALMTALSATVGLGNISGVAVAVSTGGPGAIFWMWIVGFLGMATKFTTCSLATMYREEDRSGTFRGGPMYYIEIGLGKNWKPLAMLFAFLGAVASLGAGNMFQANQVAQISAPLVPVADNSPISAQVIIGIVLFVLALIVIIGGIKRIGAFASRIVPTMIVIYLAAALWVIFANIGEVPAMFASIFDSALSGTAATGAFFGVAVKEAVALGVKRACFSNEAGLGSAPIAHAAAKTDEPIREGVVAAVGPFLDTIVVCTITALVILITQSHARPPIAEVGELRSNGEQYVATLTTVDDQPLAMLQEQVGSEISIRLPIEAREALRGQGVDREDSRVKPVPAMLRKLESGELVAMFDEDWRPDPDMAAPVVASGHPVYRDVEGIELTAYAFDTVIPGFGRWFLPIAAFFFAFSTIISWSFYGETCTRYLLGDRAVLPFKLVYVSMIVLGASFERLRPVIDFSDAMLGLMLVPNLIGTFFLAPKVMRASREYFKRLSSGEFEEDARRIAEKKKALRKSPD